MFVSNKNQWNYGQQVQPEFHLTITHFSMCGREISTVFLQTVAKLGWFSLQYHVYVIQLLPRSSDIFMKKTGDCGEVN